MASGTPNTDSNVELSVPLWKKELLQRRRTLTRAITSAGGMVKLTVTRPTVVRGDTVAVVQRQSYGKHPVHRPSSPGPDFHPDPSQPQSQSVGTMRLLDPDLSSSELISIKCNSNSDSDIKPKMVEEKPDKKPSFRSMEKHKEGKHSKQCTDSKPKYNEADYNSDSSEELQYGPGIVNKLKSKYLSMTLRDNQKHSARPSLSNLRRATSLENMLEDDSSRLQQKPHFIKKSCHSTLNKSSKISQHHAKYLGLTRGSESMKRARSMDTLIKNDSKNGLNNIGMKTSYSNGLITPSIINEDIVIVDNSPDPHSDKSKVEDTELPPHDVVKQTLRLFESTVGKTPQQKEAQSKMKTVVSKISNCNTIRNNEKLSAKTAKPLLSPKPVISPEKRFVRTKRVFPVVSSIEKTKSPPVSPKISPVSDTKKFSVSLKMSPTLASKPSIPNLKVSPTIGNKFISFNNKMSPSAESKNFNSKVSPNVESKPFNLSPRLSPSAESKQINVSPKFSPSTESKQFNVSPKKSPNVESKPFNVSPKLSPSSESKQFNVSPKVSPCAESKQFISPKMSPNVESKPFNISPKVSPRVENNKPIFPTSVPNVPERALSPSKETDRVPCSPVSPSEEKPKYISQEAREGISKEGTSMKFCFSDKVILTDKSYLPRPVAQATNTTLISSQTLSPSGESVNNTQGKQVAVIRPVIKKKISPLTDQEIEKNLINKVKSVENSKVPSSKSEDSSASDNNPQLWEKKHWQNQNTMVFNFSDRKSVPDYIENDGLIIAFRKPAKCNGDETDGEDEWDPPTSCNIRFIGDNILINGRSSLKKEPRPSKLRIQFNDEATTLFEYPSEESMSEEVSPPPAANPLPLGGGGSLSSYTPSKSAPVEKFELGVTRTNTPANVGNHKETETKGGETRKNADDEEYLRPADPEVVSPWSSQSGEETAADILF